MHIILKPDMICDFKDNTFNILNIKLKHQYNKLLEKISDFDIRILYTCNLGYNIYKKCKILKLDKTNTKFTIQYTKYTYSRIEDLRIDKINNILKS